MFGVMAGLVPAIHVLIMLRIRKDVDARGSAGDDGAGVARVPICACEPTVAGRRILTQLRSRSDKSSGARGSDYGR